MYYLGVQSVQPQPAIKIQIDPNTGKLVLPDLPATNGNFKGFFFSFLFLHIN